MKLYRKASREVPAYQFVDGVINITGKSIPFYKCDLWDVINNYLSNYRRNPDPETIVNINLEYINCYSQRYLLKSLQLLEEFNASGHNVTVHWYYENEEDPTYDLGNIFGTMINIPIEMVKI